MSGAGGVCPECGATRVQWKSKPNAGLVLTGFSLLAFALPLVLAGALLAGSWDMSRRSGWEIHIASQKTLLHIGIPLMLCLLGTAMISAEYKGRFRWLLVLSIVAGAAFVHASSGNLSRIWIAAGTSGPILFRRSTELAAFVVSFACMGACAWAACAPMARLGRETKCQVGTVAYVGVGMMLAAFVGTLTWDLVLAMITRPPPGRVPGEPGIQLMYSDARDRHAQALAGMGVLLYWGSVVFLWARLRWEARVR